MRENEGRECRRRSDQSLSARLSVPGVLLVRGRSALRVGAGFAAQPALVTLARAVPVTAGEKVLGGSFRKMGARVSSRIRVVPPRCYTARGLKREKHRGGGDGWFLSLRSGQAEGTRWQVEETAATRSGRGKVRGFMVPGWAWAAAALQSHVCF